MLRSQDRKWLSMLRQKRFQFQLCLCNRCPAWKHGGVQHSQNVDDQRSVVACGLSKLKRIDSVNVIYNCWFSMSVSRWINTDFSPLMQEAFVEQRNDHHDDPFMPQQALWCGLATNSRLWARCRGLDYLRKGWMMVNVKQSSIFQHRDLTVLHVLSQMIFVSLQRHSIQLPTEAYCAHCCNCCMSVIMDVPDLQNTSNSGYPVTLRISVYIIYIYIHIAVSEEIRPRRTKRYLGSGSLQSSSE